MHIIDYIIRNEQEINSILNNRSIDTFYPNVYNDIPRYDTVHSTDYVSSYQSTTEYISSYQSKNDNLQNLLVTILQNLQQNTSNEIKSTPLYNQPIQNEKIELSDILNIINTVNSNKVDGIN